MLRRIIISNLKRNNLRMKKNYKRNNNIHNNNYNTNCNSNNSKKTEKYQTLLSMIITLNIKKMNMAIIISQYQKMIHLSYKDKVS